MPIIQMDKLNLHLRFGIFQWKIPLINFESVGWAFESPRERQIWC